MAMDRLRALESYTDDELLDEINRRRREALQRAEKLALGTGDGSGKYARKSEAKATYWREWHAYKEQHPDATVAAWRKAQRRGTKR